MTLIAPHARAFLSLVRDFGKEYSAAKDADRALDFADLERRSLWILREGGPGAGTSTLRPGPIAARSLSVRAGG